MTRKFQPQCSTGAAPRTEPLVSIIVNNYNYARFLPQAIDSALAQQYPRTEVIVVDDGSTDNSRDIIASYGSKIRTVLKPNGGQASALNAGFQASRGDVVLFLDADDILFPHAVSNVVQILPDEGVTKVHWPMWLIDCQGQQTGGTRPAQVPPEGDFRRQVLERGPSNIASSPTSGNAWSRCLLEKIMPIPEHLAYYRKCADEYLYLLAPVFGRVRTIAQPQGCYRIHSHNIYSSRTFREKLDMELGGYDEQCEALASSLAKNAIEVDVSSWRAHSWFHRLDKAVNNILATVPAGSQLILINSDSWEVGPDFEGRFVRPFSQRFGLDWGPPTDSSQAIEQLQSLISAGAQFLVIAWLDFWWCQEYPLFFEHLDETAQCVHRDDVSIIFNLQKRPAPICCSYPARLVHEDRNDG